MNGRQIERILRRHVPQFDGVFSSDRLPERRGPKLFVANTEANDEPGDHWVAISVDRRRDGQYFDSFGRPPPKIFREYMLRHCRTWTFNRSQLQSAASDVCGHYCVVWCMLNSRGVDLSSLLCTSDTGLNDAIVRNIVGSMNM